MNYAAHYDRLVRRARGRTLSGYKERHHVLPRCMGGGNEPENLVDLTAEEHYVAHQLLVKIYPDMRGLAIAAVRMSHQCTGNKSYGWLRNRVAELQRGKPKSAEFRAKMSEVLKGNKYCLGTKQSAQTIAKRVAKLRGNKFAAGNVRSLETRKKQSNTIRSNPNLYAARVEQLNKYRHQIYSPERNKKIWETRRKKGSLNGRPVIHIGYGVFFESVIEAARHFGIPSGSIYSMLSGRLQNNTFLRYA